MTDDEHQEAIKQAGAMELYVDSLCRRLIEAEARAESLETTKQIQNSEIERLTKLLANTERARDDALRNVRLMTDALHKVSSNVKEVYNHTVPVLQEVPKITGAPVDPAKLKIVRETAIDNAAREVNAAAPNS